MEGAHSRVHEDEADISGDGALDMDDEVLAQMDVVIASVGAIAQPAQGRDDGAADQGDCNPERTDPWASHGRPLAARVAWRLTLARCCGGSWNRAWPWNTMPA